MPVPLRCRRRSCPYHRSPPPGWCSLYGSYFTHAHGWVQRYRCRHCGATASDQTESMHYFAKRRLPLLALWHSLLEGASLRECARRYHITPPTIQTALLRLGRQAMAAHLQLLSSLKPRSALVYDGLRSCVTSQDYPCDITTVVEPEGEMILTMTHTVTRRGGTMTEAQKQRVEAKEKVWSPAAGTMSADLSAVYKELWDYLRPCGDLPAVLDSDEQPLYASLLAENLVARHWMSCRLLVHRRTPGSAPRTIENPLFAVNYVDRLLRHRLREHTRESIAIGRQASLQMHRAWIFAYDHNCQREYRVKRPELGTHAAQGAVDEKVVREVNAEFFTRRKTVRIASVPDTITRVWMAELPTPPVRWKTKQKGTSVRIPYYAIDDLTDADPQAS